MRAGEAMPLLWSRVRQQWLLKFFGITGFMWLFFTAYFVLLNHPQFPVTTVPLTPLDALVPLQQSSLLLYVSLWVYVSLPPSWMTTRGELIYYGISAGALCLMGLGIFWLWPTAVPAVAIDYARYPAFAILQGVDASGNACPSLHVASAVFSGMWIHHLLRSMRFGGVMKALNWLWCIGIAYSTLATKQHVVLDVLAGTALGLVVGYLSLRARPRKKEAMG